MRIINCTQGSPEWHAARCGIPSASNFDKIVTIVGQRSKQSDKYLYQLAGEAIIGKAEETYSNGIMQRGQEMEAEARMLYELHTGNTVEQVGFCVTTDKAIYGASPDGMIGEKGLLEIKCPLLSTHVSYLLDGFIPNDYFQQTQGQLLVTGREWLDFMSYYPGMKPLIVRTTLNGVFAKMLEAELELFCADLEKTVAILRKEK